MRRVGGSAGRGNGRRHDNGSRGRSDGAHWLGELAPSGRFERGGEREGGWIARRGFSVHRARQHRVQRIHPGVGRARCERADLVTESGWPAAGQQLEGNCGQREHVCGRIPRRARNALGRTVGTAHRSAQANPLEGFDDTEAGRPGLFRCDEDVARVQRAVTNTHRTRKIDRAGELRDEGQHGGNRRRRVVPHGDVERLGGDVLLGAIGHRPLDAGGNRLDDRGMEEAGLGRPRQLIGQRLGLLGRNVETEGLHGDQPIALRLVGAEHGTERADADLVQHPEGAELGGCSEGRRIVAGQRSPLDEITKIYHILPPRGFAPRTPPRRRSRGPCRPTPLRRLARCARSRRQ